MLDIEKILKQNGWYRYYGKWKHPNYKAELAVFDIKEAFAKLAYNNGFNDVNKFVKHLENV